MQTSSKWYFNNSICVFESQRYSDERGFFSEIYNKEYLETIGIKDLFVLDSYSFSSKQYTFRGLHFQKYPYEQAKIVRAIQGSILDIVVDIRKGSDTFLKSFRVELTKENFLSIYIPKGFAHGFLTLEDNCELLYKTSNFYNKEHEMSLSCFDEQLDINLPVGKEEITISEKDLNSHLVSEIEQEFI